MRNFKIARRYAKTLLDAAVEQNVLSEVQRDSQKLLEIIKTNQDFNNFLTNPIIQPQFKQETFRQIFEGKIHTLTLNFLYLLAQRQRERTLEMLLQEFKRELNERAGIVIVHVTSAVPLTDNQKSQLSQRFSAYCGKRVQIETAIDTRIKGGFIARLGDTIFDGSVTTQLERLKKYLTA